MKVHSWLDVKNGEIKAFVKAYDRFFDKWIYQYNILWFYHNAIYYYDRRFYFALIKI